jgi:hypothetical protein
MWTIRISRQRLFIRIGQVQDRASEPVAANGLIEINSFDWLGAYPFVIAESGVGKLTAATGAALAAVKARR